MKAFLIRTILIIVSVILLIQLWIFASLVWWRTNPVNTTMMMRIDYWTEPSKPIQHQWRPYDEISLNLKRAIVTVEDGKFIHHHGFDWDGIQTALNRNKNEGRVVAGGSTISQQLAKNLFLINKRSFVRKGQEAIATWMMERMWSKERILEVYLNSIEFGDNIYGVEAAAKHYFGKTSQSLSRDQAVFLAAILTNPKYFQDHRHSSALKARKRMIQRYMNYAELP
ncbi:monofunctional biosynthetic peptidoglycan transglycosylase [Acinetobacter bohemicus]|uniref:Biosynthetic peptidoglycan transglycosylase n=1 Tax=Acinetobacter lwoffii TaxID=28090 RepID=A0A9D2UT78_ACILW|nr:MULTISPECIES: monofunctional biosynthetic peptidoglycan transglycosylase [Acinetobacter]MDM1781882.1 monofunctional biosynthetic peptidoglycan transglycosylase [Acinetobacter indicus]HJF28102.1 monofunctional biosynthetic peptidoglycan transglycosylase [Acinetobacter lwoffii]MCO8041557.1 monofunctional biosynthetic peptidoglycan transglycosylase [Acinetobacter sp. S4400-12]MCO8044604.1 monofunctional biosynthetic peptidoglycan transglycosylase [Acinetobacter sp. S4397-1]MCU7223581.1 monofun